jgi:hypothetical protein
MPSMIGSVVKTNVSEDFYSCTQDDQSNRSIAITNRGTNTSDSAPKERRNSDRSIPFSEVHHLKRARKKGNGIQREQLIECLVNFSSHIANSVLEDLVSHELEYINEVSSKDLDEEESTISGESFSSLSSGAKCSVTEKCCVDRLPPGEPLATGLQWNRHLLPPSRERESALLFVDITGFTKLSTVLDVESLSKVINSYFEMIVTEVIMHGGVRFSMMYCESTFYVQKCTSDVWHISFRTFSSLLVMLFLLSGGNRQLKNMRRTPK